MTQERLVDLFIFCIPALITGLIAYYFFKTHTQNEDGRRRFLLQKDLKTQTTPLRLQAYERLTLFLERITLNKLLVRVHPISEQRDDYESLLIATIEQEFEHNLAQQIYVSDDCWKVLLSCKNNTIQYIRKSALNDKVKTANDLREQVLTDQIDSKPPTAIGIAFIKAEVSQMW